MTHKQIITRLMKTKKINEPELSRLLGKKSNASVWKWLHKNDDMQLKTFLALLDVLGMEAVIRPKGKFRTKYHLTEKEE